MRALSAWKRWQEAAGPWRAYAVCPVLTMSTLHAPELPPLDPREEEGELEKLLHVHGTALVLDLDPVVGVTLAARLSEQRLAHAVLVLPRWPHTQAILPYEELQSALTRTATWLPREFTAPHVVFVLDANRRKALPNRPLGDPRIDNRYDLSPSDLPDLRTLRKAGIGRIVKLTRAPT